MSDSAQSIIGDLSEGVTNTFDTMGNLATSGVDGVANTLTTGIDYAADGLTSVVDGTGALVKDTFSGAKTVLDTGVNLVKSGAEAVISTVTNATEGLAETVGTILGTTAKASDTFLNKELSLVETDYFMTFFKLVVIVYAGYFAPKLDSSFAPVLTNPFFKVTILSLIVWLSSKDPVASVLVATAFYMSITYLTNNSIQEVQNTGVVTEENKLALGAPTQSISNPQGLLVYGSPNRQTINTPMVSASGQVMDVTPPVPTNKLVSANIPTELHQMAAV
jgi:hypothetical protein